MENIKLTKEQRYVWVDLIKGIAIIAVVMDHLFGAVYSNAFLHFHTSFSVSLFILMAGVTSSLSISKREIIDFKYSLKRLMNIFIPYLVATIIYSIYNNRYIFDFQLTYKYLLSFSASPPFYFVLFYMELVLASVFIYKIVNHKKSKIADVFILFIFYYVSFVLNKQTRIGTIYGGGGVLLGGSYLFIYTLGFYLKKYEEIFNRKITLVVLLISSIASLSALEIYNLVPKAWTNPPNGYLIIYAITIFALIFSVYNLVLYKIQKVLIPLVFLGKNSLYVFLYHKLCITLFFQLNLGVKFQNVKYLYSIIVILVVTYIPAFIGMLTKTNYFKGFTSFFKYPVVNTKQLIYPIEKAS